MFLNSRIADKNYKKSKGGSILRPLFPFVHRREVSLHEARCWSINRRIHTQRFIDVTPVGHVPTGLCECAIV